MWNFKNNQVHKLSENEEYNFYSCVSWNHEGTMLNLGSLNGAVQIYDIEKNKKIVELEDHIERVGALSLHGNLLLTGSRDHRIFMYDIRDPKDPINCY